MESLPGIACGGVCQNRGNEPSGGFYDYYQILLDSNADDDESEEFGAKDERELKGRMDGLHSPFGMLGKIKTERGYTHEYLLWSESWVNLLMENADAPRYTKKQYTPAVEGADELREALGR